VFFYCFFILVFLTFCDTQHLPAHAVAIPMHNYAQNQQNQQNAQYAQYAAEYYPSEAERENAGLLQKM
jgi:hypothetical protein